jgi:hypothetical protein
MLSLFEKFIENVKFRKNMYLNIYILLAHQNIVKNQYFFVVCAKRKKLRQD